MGISDRDNIFKNQWKIKLILFKFSLLQYLREILYRFFFFLQEKKFSNWIRNENRKKLDWLKDENKKFRNDFVKFTKKKKIIVLIMSVKKSSCSHDFLEKELYAKKGEFLKNFFPPSYSGNFFNFWIYINLESFFFFFFFHALLSWFIIKHCCKKYSRDRFTNSH